MCWVGFGWFIFSTSERTKLFSHRIVTQREDWQGMEVNFLSQINVLSQRKMPTSLCRVSPFSKTNTWVWFFSVFVYILEFIYCFHFLNLLKCLQERKLRREILWLEADPLFIFLGKFFHWKDKTRSHKNVLFLGDNSMETWKS